MNKAEWYKHLIGHAEYSIKKSFFFEASFISYGIIEDRLNSMMTRMHLPIGRKGVAAKIKALAKVRNPKSEKVFLFKDWDGGKYKDLGIMKDVLAWGELYRNPMQHQLGDPRNYKAQIGDFHTVHTKDMAIQGVRVARELSSAVMRFKKK